MGHWVMCLRLLPPKPMFLLNQRSRGGLTLRAPAFECWNGFVHCSADSGNDGVGILIYNILSQGNLNIAPM